MADLYNIINRCSLLLEKLEKSHYPSKRDLKAYLEANGEARSDRTIDRALDALREEFDLEIRYNQQENGYYIDWDASLNPSALYRILEQGKTLTLLQTSASRPKEVLKCIQFEEQGQLTGLEYLQPVMQAILDQKYLRFYHAAFGKPHALPYRVAPYLLKEYQNRWYIVGIPDSKSDFRFFGIDRITEIEVLDETFEAQADQDSKAIFEDRVGISNPHGPMEVVELVIDPSQSAYLKTLPLHPSQTIVKDDEHELRIQLFVKPNFELKRKILELTDCAKVTYPHWLAKAIKDTLRKAIDRYEV